MYDAKSSATQKIIIFIHKEGEIMKKAVIVLFVLLISACSSLKVAKLDPKTGLFPSENKATVVTSKPLDIDQKKSLILVSDSAFAKQQIINIGYFDKVINHGELEVLIVKNDLSDKISSVHDKLGINKAAKYYKPFLWFRINTKNRDNKKYAQFILTDPLTLDDYFVTETLLDYKWTGVNDQNNWYPMFNALIEYIKKNSNTYK